MRLLNQVCLTLEFACIVSAGSSGNSVTLGSYAAQSEEVEQDILTHLDLLWQLICS